MEKRKRRKLDMTPPQHKILGESSTKRSQKLIAHTKVIIDDMVKKGIPLTVEGVHLMQDVPNHSYTKVGKSEIT